MQDTVNYDEIFSAQPFTYEYKGQPFHYYAIAVYGVILWDVWEDGSKAPFFWEKRDDVQELIKRREPDLLKLLSCEGLIELHKERYDRIMAASQQS